MAPKKTTSPAERQKPERAPVRALVSLYAQGVSSKAKHLLLVLNSHASDDGACWPSIATLSLETGLSRRGIQLALRELETHGFIHARATAEGGRQRVNIYTIDYVASAASVPAQLMQNSPALQQAFGGAHQVRPSDPTAARSDDPASTEGRTLCAPHPEASSGAHSMRPTTSDAEGRTTCAPAGDAENAVEGRTSCAPQAGRGAHEVRGGGAPGAPGGAHEVRTEQSRVNSPENTHTPAPASADESEPPFGVPGLTPGVCEIIALGTALPHATPETDEEAREQAHSAMFRHPDRSKVVSGNVIAARMLAAGEITAALLEAAVAHYAETTKGQSRFIHRDNWLNRGCWRDSLAGAVAAVTGREQARAAAEVAEFARAAERDAERAAIEADAARTERVRTAMAAMDARELATLARRRLDDLRAATESPDAETRARAKGLLMVLSRREVSPSCAAWRSALADDLDPVGAEVAA